MLADSIKSLLLGGTTYYPISDADTTLTMNGKSWNAIPKQITIPAGFLVNLDTSMYEYNDGDGFRLKDDHTAKVVAVGKDDYIVHPQQSWYSDTYRDNSNDGRSNGYYKYIEWLKVPKNQAQNVIWGGNVLAIYLKQLLASLARKVVLVC